MSNLDHDQLDELLSAYLDGELDAEETTYVERILETDVAAQRLLADLRRTVDAVSALPRHSAPGGLVEDISAQLERSALIGEPSEIMPVSAGASRSPWSTLLSMAAAMVVIATGVLWYTYNPNGVAPKVQTVTTFDPNAENDEADVATRTKKEESPRDDNRFSRASRRGRGGEFFPKARRTIREGEEKSLSREAADAVNVATSVTTPPTTVPPVAAVGRMEESAWLASATVDQIVSINGRASQLMSHRFTNEAIRLTIPVDDGAKGEQLAGKLVDTLRSVDAKNVASSSPDVPLRELAKSGFYLQGRAGTNFEASEAGREVLVYIPVRERDALLDEVGRWPGVDERAVLNVGPIKVRGFTQSRLALAGADRQGDKALGRRTPEAFGGDAGVSNGERGREKRDRPEEVVAPGLGILADLAEMLTKQPDKPAASQDAEERPAAASPPIDSVAQAKLPTSRTASEPESREADAKDQAVLTDGRTDVAGQPGPVSEAKVADADSLVSKRLKEITAPRKAKRSPSAPAETELADRYRSDKGRYDSALDTSSIPVPSPVTEEPDQFITLVFSFVPPKSSVGPGRASKSDSTPPIMKAKRDQPPRLKKTPKNAKPIQK